MATAYTDQVQKVYIAYYGRAADPVGLAYWAGKVETDGIAGIMASFGASAEASTLYGNLSDTAMVNALYQQSFGRDADFAGLMYYANALTAGTMTAASIAQNIFDGASGADATILANKLVVAKAYTAAIDSAAEVVAYSGTVAASSARALLTTVDADTVTTGFDVATSVASIVSVSEATPAVASTTLTLTSTTDSLTGGAGDDIINGVVQAAGVTGTTIAPGDTITGGAGVDSLVISTAGALAANSDYTLSAVSTSGVEKVLLSNFQTTNTSDHVVDTTLMSGLTHLGTNASSAEGDTSFTNIKNIVDAQMSNGAGDLSLTYGTTVVSGTSDVQNLAVSNITGGVFTAASVETLNVSTSTVASTITTITADKMTALNVTGDKNLTITNAVDFVNNASATAVDGVLDAATFTGKLTATMAADVVTVTGGTGADTIKMGTGLAASDTLDGGAGDDTLVANSSATTLANMSISNFETIQIEAVDDEDVTITSAGQAGLVSITLEENADGGNDNTDNYTVTDLAAGVGITLLNNTDARDMNLVALGLADASGTADSLTVTLKGTSAHLAADNSVNDISFASIETLNLISSHDGTVALLATDDNTVDDISADAELTTLNISGSDQANITVGTEATKLATINAAGMTDVLTLTVGAAAANAITLGSAKDVVNFGTTLTIADSVDGGLGADTVNATVGALSAANGKFNLTSVETLALTHTTTTATNIDMALATDTTAVTVVSSADGGTGTVTITNLGSAATVSLATGNDFDGTLDVSLADATGTADSVTIGLNDETTGANKTDVTLKVAAAVETTTLTVPKFRTDGTTANTGDTDANIAGVASASIVVTGGNSGTDLDLLQAGTMSATTTSLDSTAFIGTLTATASANVATTFKVDGAQVQTLIGSSKADTVTVDSTAATHVIDGGAGADTLNMTASGTISVATVNNFETINFTVAPSATAVTTAAAANFWNDSDLTTLNILGGNSLSAISLIADGVDATSGMTVLNAGAFEGTITDLLFDADQLDSTVTITGAKSASDKIRAVYDTAATYTAVMSDVETFGIDLNAAAAVVVDLTSMSGISTIDVTSGEQATLTIKNIGTETINIAELVSHASNKVDLQLVSETGKSDSITIKSGAANTDANSGIVTTNIETVNFNVDNALSFDAVGITMTEAAGETAGSNKVKIVASGDSAFTLKALHADLSDLDASALTGAMVITAASSSATNITGGSAGDTLLGGAAADVIIGGGGADDITGAAGLDTLTGGAGADTFNIAVESSKFIFDTITDIADADIIAVANQGIETFTTAAKTLSGDAALSDFLDLAAAGDGSTNGIFTWFNYGGNTFVVQDQTAGAIFTVATDMVVKLTGVHDLSLSDVGNALLTIDFA